MNRSIRFVVVVVVLLLIAGAVFIVLLRELDRAGPQDAVPVLMNPVRDVRVGEWVEYRREGGKITWWIDGQHFLEYDDPRPLTGGGHQYFGFNNWEAPVSFDNLVIRAL